jgi:hypothetical protein
MKKHHKNRGGAPKGNQNARKHGYYSHTLTPAQQAQLPDVDPDLRQELKLMMLKMASLNKNQPENYRLQIRAASLYNRMFKNYYDAQLKTHPDLGSNHA